MTHGFRGLADRRVPHQPQRHHNDLQYAQANAKLENRGVQHRVSGWIHWRGQIYSTDGRGEGETIEKRDYSIHKVLRKASNVNYSNQDEDKAHRDGRV